jgi:acetoin utilization deacetylase AcuC-like enzyme
VFYLAGADPFEHDQLGGLGLTKAGLRRRDRLVFNAALELEVPVVLTLAGGYARDVSDTVEIHANTIEDAIRTFENYERRTTNDELNDELNDRTQKGERRHDDERG